MRISAQNAVRAEFQCAAKQMAGLSNFAPQITDADSVATNGAHIVATLQ
jgi:hypothetical protein